MASDVFLLHSSQPATEGTFSWFCFLVHSVQESPHLVEFLSAFVFLPRTLPQEFVGSGVPVTDAGTELAKLAISISLVADVAIVVAVDLTMSISHVFAAQS